MLLIKRNSSKKSHRQEEEQGTAAGPPSSSPSLHLVQWVEQNRLVLDAVELGSGLRMELAILEVKALGIAGEPKMTKALGSGSKVTCMFGNHPGSDS